MEQVESNDTVQFRGVFENYAYLEVVILYEQDGGDPEENGDGDENEKEEGVYEEGVMNRRILLQNGKRNVFRTLCLS